jgi:hypothetical protein
MNGTKGLYSNRSCCNVKYLVVFLYLFVSKLVVFHFDHINIVVQILVVC